MLALSDISGPGARLESSGYLTGYPLSESGFFALARTWPAPEMSRPGCVWTHTLLIDFTDLAAWESLTALTTLFEHPSEHKNVQVYSTPKLLSDDNQRYLNSIDPDWARMVLSALYINPRRKIVVTGKTAAEADDTVLAIWSQQWPRLRRSFRFCTLAATDRSSESGNFDLQVLPKLDRSIRGQFTDAVDAESLEPAVGEWLDYAVDDLMFPDEEVCDLSSGGWAWTWPPGEKHTDHSAFCIPPCGGYPLTPIMSVLQSK